MDINSLPTLSIIDMILIGWLNRLFRVLTTFDNLNLTCMVIFHVVSCGTTCLIYIEFSSNYNNDMHVQNFTHKLHACKNNQKNLELYLEMTRSILEYY
jgi:hypothetical protein